MGRRSLKEDQQKRIIEAFYEVAKREGIENTSFGKVAKELNMRQSLIIHYFATKEEMTLGLIDLIVMRYENIYLSESEEGNALEKLVTVMHNIFSRKWDSYIDDSVFYNCFALIFRNEVIKHRFRELHLLLRGWLQNLIQVCNDQGLIKCEDASRVSDLIFVISDGAYYYLSMIQDKKEYDKHLERYRKEAFKLLGLESQ
ncbi:TetR family transcriptional regulator [Desertivirga arenae]|uniref:TetR family transcriptional regulator n=1 Tax=Desertivirga arenae TaxID=2810309 RepID=UPI001A969AFE|nr:TetR family transcriptional regulator [Pedobacter sp. SYSU D00823]